jgi:HPt (histidine-containing phosphotransfer) domain-containing protein
LSNTDRPAIDAATVAALQEDGSLLQELRDLFAAETAEQLARMLQACREGDAKTLAMAAHRLKGSAVTFGAWEMQSRCVNIETLANGGKMDGAEGLIGELASECKRVNSSLDQVIDNPPSKS